MSNGMLKKTSAAYNYKYCDLAEIHKYLEENDMRYYQYINTEDGDDFIYTVPIINGEERPARRGCRVVDAPLSGKSNPAQEQGSAITYARRYSLLMAFGLATEDDDAESLTRPAQPAQRAQQAAPKQTDEKITDKDITTLRELFKNKGIEESFVLKIYKLDKLDGIKQSVYANMIKNADKIAEKQKEEKK